MQWSCTSGVYNKVIIIPENSSEEPLVWNHIFLFPFNRLFIFLVKKKSSSNILHRDSLIFTKEATKRDSNV